MSALKMTGHQSHRANNFVNYEDDCTPTTPTTELLMRGDTMVMPDGRSNNGKQKSSSSYEYPGPKSEIPLQPYPNNNFNNQAHQPYHQFSATTSTVPLQYENQPQPSNHSSQFSSEKITSPTKAIVLQTITTLSTVVFTVVPVLVTTGDDPTWNNWYSWQDACRLIEPFCSGMLHTWFFYNSDLMRRWENEHDSAANSVRPSSEGQSSSTPKKSRRFRLFLSAVFTFFLMVYVAGASIHFSAALFKNAIVLFLEQHSRGIGLSTHPLTNGDGQLSLALAVQLREGYIFIQDVWEHNVSHYMYAFGALGMSWCEMVAYSGQVLPEGVNLARIRQKDGQLVVQPKNEFSLDDPKSNSKWLVFLWAFAGLLYGAIVAGVSCQYPKGLYVGSIYVVLLLLVVCFYIIRKGGLSGLFSLGRYYILQTYVIGGVVAVVAIVIYMAAHKFNMLTSNDTSHLGSLRTPVVA
ncbi:hypothetical protein BGX26_001976 [Mortierella sp. AD094]|nr:hypothetical protein BGX26_001976 [Mortierella sp. AD094]